MNIILFQKSEVSPENDKVFIPAADRRAVHIRNILKSKVGDTIRTGLINGLSGTAKITDITSDGGISLTTVFNKIPPAPWFDILLAMPRPKVMHRLWAKLSALGAGKIFLTNAAKVEKYYFDNHWLSESSWGPLLQEGLEQSGATTVPEVYVKRQLKPFIQDEIPGLYPDAVKLIAHPHFQTSATRLSLPLGTVRPLVAIGPEGGWTDFELKLFNEAGFLPISLGDRILRTDTACVAIAGALKGAAIGSSL